MQCNAFEMRMQRLLDQRLRPEQDDQLRSHADVCAECREMLSGQERLFTALELSEIPPLSDGFTDRVLQSLERRPGSNQFTTRHMSLALAIAATLLIAIVPTISWWQSQPAGRNAERSAVDNSAVVIEGSRSVASVAGEPAGSEWWKEQTQSLWELYPPQVRARHRQQVDRLADDLRPLTSSFTAAVTALKRSLPTGKPREKSQPQATNRAADWLHSLT
jgi:hypothetical protein